MSVKVVYEASVILGLADSGGDLGLVLLGDGQGLGKAFHGHVAAGDEPVVVLLGKHGADQADDGGAVGKNADDVRCAGGSRGAGVPAGCWTRSGASARWGRR
jgi:hypothetical protein